MTRKEAEATRKRAEAATAGPWQARFLYRVFQCARKHAGEDKLMVSGSPEQDRVDCEHMAHARTDVPALVAALEKAWRDKEFVANKLAQLGKSSLEQITILRSLIDGAEHEGAKAAAAAMAHLSQTIDGLQSDLEALSEREAATSRWGAAMEPAMAALEAQLATANNRLDAARELVKDIAAYCCQCEPKFGRTCGMHQKFGATPEQHIETTAANVKAFQTKQLATARTALEPFARIAQKAAYLGEGVDGNSLMFNGLASTLTIGDVRRAADAIDAGKVGP